jgi:hypothetical protein
VAETRGKRFDVALGQNDLPPVFKLNRDLVCMAERSNENRWNEGGVDIASGDKHESPSINIKTHTVQQETRMQYTLRSLILHSPRP